MIKKIALLIGVVGLLGGCATTYKYEGKTYDTKEKMYVAIDEHVTRVLATVTPLPKPLTQKKLIFAIPSLPVFTEVARQTYIKREGKEATEQAIEVGRNIDRGNLKLVKVFYDAVQKRNIYASTQFLEMESGAVNIPASEDADSLYYFVGGVGSAQWFYATNKNGKQVFSYDRSDPTPEGKVKAFVEAVQAQAIRD